MSYFNQFYTGAEQAYFPAPSEGGNPLRKRRRALLAATVVAVSVAVLLTIVAICWLWDGTPAANLTVVPMPVRKPIYPAVHVAAQQEPFAPPDSEKHRTKVAKSGGPAETQSTQLPLLANPQLRSIVLANPAVPPPFPTEQNLPVGMPRAHLVRAFGRPDLSARTL